MLLSFFFLKKTCYIFSSSWYFQGSPASHSRHAQIVELWILTLLKAPPLQMLRRWPWMPHSLPHSHRLIFSHSAPLSLFHVPKLHQNPKRNLMLHVIRSLSRSPSCSPRLKFSCYLKQILNLTFKCPHNNRYFPRCKYALNQHHRARPLREPPRLIRAAPGHGERVGHLLCSCLVPSTTSSLQVTAAGFHDVLHSCHTCLLHGQAVSGRGHIQQFITHMCVYFHVFHMNIEHIEQRY